MRNQIIFHGLLTGWCVLVCSPIMAADKNGVSPQTISLPSGPGSIQGLGESFQPQLNSGSGSHSIPIQLPKGPAGFAPSLTLQYHTGNSNGILGVGWKLSGPTMVSRNMDAGLPLYVDAPNSIDDDFDGTIDNPQEIDRFSSVDLEEILPLADGTLRSESEGSFLRYERIGASWQARSKNGLLHEFGTTSSAQIENGARVFAWLLDRTTDLNGNQIEYRYISDPSSPGQKHCKEIRWARDPAFYAVVLSYDGNRPDVHSDYRSGFEVRTALRLARIDVIAQGVPASSGAVVGDLNQDGQPDSLIRRYELEYEPNTLQSLLRRVTVFGSDGVLQLPSVSFEYTTWVPLHDTSVPMVQSTGDPAAGMNSNDVELIDMNRDGLPDLLHATASTHRLHLNQGINDVGRVAWDTVGTLVGNAPNLNLGSTAIHLADHSADGESDLIHKVNGATFQCFLNSGQNSWALPVSLQNTDSWPQWPFENPGSRTLDTDHNRLNDILFTSDNSFRLWMMMPGGRYGKEVPLPVLNDGTQAFGFDEPGARIADVNGDRISDLVWIQSTRIVFWASCGRGNFDGPIFRPFPLGESLNKTEISRSDFADVNGDALADLIIVRPAALPNGIHYRLNLGHNGFSSLRTILGLPAVVCTGTPPNQICDAVRWADMNGNGSVDLLISNGNRPSGTREQFLDLVPGVRPHLLRRIDNGLGLVTTLEYESSVQQMVRAQIAGNPWILTMPISIPVVSRITESDSRGSDFIREFTYRDPYYEPIRQEFRGFSRTEAQEIGDASAPTKIVTYVFDTGVQADCRKGMVLSQEVSDAAASLFERVDNTVQHRILDSSVDGRQVCFAFNAATDTQVFEQTNNPAHLRTEYQYDDFGNVLQENMHGIVDQDADEVFVEKAYQYDPAIWLMDRVTRTTTRDGQGTLAAEDLYSYDQRGNMLEMRRWLDTGNRYLLSVRNEYDAFGNVTRITDANDHSRSVTYDPLLQTYPISEIVHLEAHDLTATANYDMALGTVVSSVDFAGAMSTWKYDSLARLIALHRPGGALTSYEYNLGNPVSQIATRILENTGSSGTFDRFDYFDGYGRKLGGKVEAEDGQWRFVDAVGFNARKLERLRWLPYHTSTPTYEIPDPLLPHHVLAYDAPGRTVQMTSPDGTFARTVYEPLVQHNHDENDTAGAAMPTTLRTDGLKRLVEVTERNGPNEDYTSHYVWNTLGNLIQITDAQGNKKFMDYDSLQRSITLHDPDRGTLTYHHDDVGNLLRTTDARGQQIAYSYDFANRLLAENYLDQGRGAVDPVDVQYNYDVPSNQVDFGDGQSATATFTGGRLASVADLSGEEHRSYDARGNVLWRVKRIRDPVLDVLVPFTAGFTYDEMDRVTEVDYPDGDRCAYAYNAASFLESASGGPGGQEIVANAAYEPTGLLSQFTFGNGVVTTYSFDGRDRLIGLRTTSPSIGDLINYSYIFDPVSNITRINDNRAFTLAPFSSPRRNTQLFLYDDLHRLSQVKYSPFGDGAPTLGQIDYAYDQIGNMLSQSCPAAGQQGHIANPDVCVGAMISGGALGTQNRIGRLPGDPPGPHALTASQSGGAYAYDDNGNMAGLDDAVLTWDFKDRLVRFQKDDIDARYIYDYTGRRIVKHVLQGKTTDQTLYVDPIFEYRPNRAPIKYVFNGATRLAQVKGTLDPSRPRVQRFWMFPGWNLLTIAVQTIQTVEELFGTGALVYEWTGSDYQLVAANSFAPTGVPLWVEVTSARVVAALGPYDPPTNPITIPAGQSLIAWPKLEPFVPAEHLAAELRIHTHDSHQMGWLTIDASLPPIIADFINALPTATAAWFTAPTENMLLPAAADDRATLFYHGDHLGSAHVLSGQNGVVFQEDYYYPFGATRHTHAPVVFLGAPYGFTQKEADVESELHYFEARYLGAGLSRFMSTDPKFANPAMLSKEDLSSYLSQPQKINLYSYVLNNPLKYSDPTGLDEDKSVIALGVGVSGGIGEAPFSLSGTAGVGIYYELGSDDSFSKSFGFYATAGAGGQYGTPASGDASVVFSYNNKGLQSFAGDSTEYGGSLGAGPSLGADVAFSDTGGQTMSISVGAGAGGEAHVRRTTTATASFQDVGDVTKSIVEFQLDVFVSYRAGGPLEALDTLTKYLP